MSATSASAATRRATPSLPPLVVVSVFAGVALFCWCAPHHHGRTTLAPAVAELVARRSLRVEPLPQGGHLILDAATGARLVHIPANGDGFVGGLLHGLNVIRSRNGVAGDPTLELEATSGGRLVLIDQPTQTVIDLEGFGPTNAALFARALAAPETRP